MKKMIISAAVALACLAAFAKQDTNPVAFKAGENVCLVGDSITHGGRYVKPLVLFYATRYPESKINFYNTGISGDTVQYVNKRLEGDVLSFKPNAATLMIGMNNCGVFEGKEKGEAYKKRVSANRDSYRENLDSILKKFKDAKCRVILFTPSIYDETAVLKDKPAVVGWNAELKVFAGIGEQLAKKYGAKVVDMWGFMLETNSKFQKDFPEKSMIGTDRVHPMEMGGFAMAANFIRTFGEAEYVSRASIDASSRKMVENFNCDIDSIKFENGGLSFGMLAHSLPFPTNGEILLGDKYVNFLKDYNREILKISGLPSGKFGLFIDGTPVGTYEAKELASGVNLADLKTPQRAQAEDAAKKAEVFRNAVNEYRNIHATEMWHNLYECGSDAERIEKVKSLLAADKIKHPYIKSCAKNYIVNKPKQDELFKKTREAFDDLYKAAQPVRRVYELKRG